MAQDKPCNFIGGVEKFMSNFWRKYPAHEKRTFRHARALTPPWKSTSINDSMSSLSGIKTATTIYLEIRSHAQEE